MSWLGTESLLSSLMGPTPLAIIIAILLVVTVPLFLHFAIFRSASSTTLPTILLLGPSGSGKTSLLTLFDRGQCGTTCTSQTPLTVEVSLPVTTSTTSSSYRSVNDPTNNIHKKFLLADTPGHGKLRYHAFDSLVKSQNLQGIIFMVDAADISENISGAGNEPLRQAAEYLYDVLLLLQKRSRAIKSSKAIKNLPLLIAANKQDLFTALPIPLVKSHLESEVATVRSSRNKGLLDLGIGMNDSDFAEEKESLGDGGESKFKFSQMDDYNIPIKVVGANVMSADGADVKHCWDWIGSLL